MATIPVNDKYQIASDKRSWFIQERRKKKGVLIWEAVAWYGSLEQTVKSLGNRMVRESCAQGVGELLDEAERVSTVLCRALTLKLDEIEGLQVRLPDPLLIERLDLQISDVDFALDVEALDLQLPGIEDFDLRLPDFGEVAIQCRGGRDYE